MSEFDDDLGGNIDGESKTVDMPKSIAERAEAAANGQLEKDDEERQQLLFEHGVVDGDGITVGSLIPPGARVETKVKMLGHKVPLRTGLLDPTKMVTLQVTCWPEDYSEKPSGEKLGDGTRNIEKWLVNCSLKPEHIKVLGTYEKALQAVFLDILAIGDGTRAGKALDSLNDLMTEYLTSGVVPEGPLD